MVRSFSMIQILTYIAYRHEHFLMYQGVYGASCGAVSGKMCEGGEGGLPSPFSTKTPNFSARADVVPRFGTFRGLVFDT